MDRRYFLQGAAAGLVAGGWRAAAQEPGVRPRQDAAVSVLSPRLRPVASIIIDDSTCLVNLNKFAVPQFAQAWGGGDQYAHDWRSWPAEIPDEFVRRFVDWAAENEVRGKYSVVPYPACVGRVDRLLPGWSQKSLWDSLSLVREHVAPGWDIHPEMVTHTWAIDLKTGHPHRQWTTDYQENWGWTVGKSVDEIAAYQAYALQILKNVELPCEGVTTPGGYGNRVLPQLAQATFESVRSVYGAEIPHYFRHLYSEGDRSVAPRVEYAAGLDTSDPRCVVSIIGCTGDWTGGWDCTGPVEPDRFIRPDLSAGRMVEVIERDEPAVIVCHWTGVYYHGQELGFAAFREIVDRLRRRYPLLNWMKLSEIARYAAAKELTQIERATDGFVLRAPYACPAFTLRAPLGPRPRFFAGADAPALLAEAASPADLAPGKYLRQGDQTVVCFDLPRGASRLDWLSTQAGL